MILLLVRLQWVPEFCDICKFEKHKIINAFHIACWKLGLITVLCNSLIFAHYKF